ncbi:MAG TPA: hypothetical protein VIZ64_00190 [Dokdonella sp.]
MRCIENAACASSAGIVERVASSCARARRVEVVGTARVEAGIDQAQRLALVVGVRARYAQAFLQAAQIEVGAREVADDRDLRGGKIGRSRAGIGVLGFDAAANASEQVQFPAGVDADAVALAIARVAIGAGLLVGARAGIGGLGTRAHHRKGVEPRAAQLRLRTVPGRKRDAQVVVGSKGVGHEAIQQWISEAAPERVVAPTRFGGGRSIHEVGEALRGRGVRPHVVGTDGAGRERRAQCGDLECAQRAVGDRLMHGCPPRFRRRARIDWT